MQDRADQTRPWRSIEEYRVDTARWVDRFSLASTGLRRHPAIGSRLPAPLSAGSQPPAEVSDQRSPDSPGRCESPYLRPPTLVRPSRRLCVNGEIRSRPAGRGYYRHRTSADAWFHCCEVQIRQPQSALGAVRSAASDAAHDPISLLRRRCAHHHWTGARRGRALWSLSL